MGKPSHKLSESGRRLNKRDLKQLCVTCGKQPPDGTNPRNKNKPYKTCAGCRAQGHEAKLRSLAADAAEVAEATQAAVTPFWDRYQHAYFRLSNLGMKIGRGGVVQ
jgi:hypothetical protein